jgi:Cdc6-like AAA superfamily ATPase
MLRMDHGSVLPFARVDFRNDDRVFGIKEEDRFSHLYVIGKTGTGKSTLIEKAATELRRREPPFPPGPASPAPPNCGSMMHVTRFPGSPSDKLSP